MLEVKSCKQFYHIEVGLPRYIDIQSSIFRYDCDFYRTACHSHREQWTVLWGPYYTTKQNFEVSKFRTFITYCLLGYECSKFVSLSTLIIQQMFRIKTLKFWSCNRWNPRTCLILHHLSSTNDDPAFAVTFFSHLESSECPSMETIVIGPLMADIVGQRRWCCLQLATHSSDRSAD